MKHLAASCFSHWTGKRYTATGLGDRIHCLTCAWAYGPPVTLHIDSSKMTGGQYGNKPDSWAEIAALFPGVYWRAHDVLPSSDAAWLAYLKAQGVDAPLWRYGDIPAPHEPEGAVDIAPQLRALQRLTAEPLDDPLPARYVTEQWDSNGMARRIDHPERVRDEYRAAGFDIVTLGRPVSMRFAAYALSRATFHIGVDSGFFHLALLYLPPERIHLYRGRTEAHHVRRARANGVCVLG